MSDDARLTVPATAPRVAPDHRPDQSSDDVVADDADDADDGTDDNDDAADTSTDGFGDRGADAIPAPTAPERIGLAVLTGVRCRAPHGESERRPLSITRAPELRPPILRIRSAAR